MDDRELVSRCRSGSEAAFRELVDTYKGMVFAVISRSVSNRGAVEDLAQDVFIRVHRGLRSFRGDARLSTWICRIAMNVCADALQVPLGTVKTHLHRAKQELREILERGNDS